MKKLSYLLLTIFFVLLSCSVCFAGSRYVEIGKNDRVAVYLDAETLIKTEDSIECWAKILFTNKGQQQNEDKRVRYSLQHGVYYPDRTTSFLGSAEYDKNGKFLSSYTVPDDEIEIEDIIPNSLGEDIWKYLFKQ